MHPRIALLGPILGPILGRAHPDRRRPDQAGRRNPAAASDGSIYLQNAQAGELVVVSPAS